jgi:hypothetical protein
MYTRTQYRISGKNVLPLIFFELHIRLEKSSSISKRRLFYFTRHDVLHLGELLCAYEKFLTIKIRQHISKFYASKRSLLYNTSI